jgi:signal transduction histidine kinase
MEYSDGMGTEMMVDIDGALRALATPATKPVEVAELCREALGVDAVIFWIRRGRHLQTFAIAPRELDGEVSVDMQVGEGIAGRVAEKGEPAILTDMQDPDEMTSKGFDLMHGPVVARFGWRGGMFVPVYSGRRMVGIFGAYSKEAGALSGDIQQHVFGAFANRVASELHHSAIADEFDRVTALGLAALDRAHSIDNANFKLQGAVERLEKFYSRRVEKKPDLGTPEIAREIKNIHEHSSNVESNVEALIHQDRLKRSSKVRLQAIGPILQGVVARHEGDALRKKIALSLAAEPDVLAYVRKNDFERVIDNLIINAIHFHPFNESGSKRYIRVTAVRQEEPETTVVAVEDNGPGIPEKDLPFVFDLMWSSPRYGGSGFGLFFARRIIEAFGGTIEVHSVEFRQTRFVIELNR